MYAGSAGLPSGISMPAVWTRRLGDSGPMRIFWISRMCAFLTCPTTSMHFASSPTVSGPPLLRVKTMTGG